METKTEKVAVIGASEKDDRYSYKAMKMLEEMGHTAIPVAPARETILGLKAYHRVNLIEEQLDTVTLYVGPARQESIIDQIIEKRPKRVIFNPGTENPDAEKKLNAAGIDTMEACTLVLLRTGQF